jgi:heme exporter protein CcmD
MAEYHWNFVAVSYALTAAALVIEMVALARRRRRVLAQIVRERDFDEDERDD